MNNSLSITLPTLPLLELYSTYLPNNFAVLPTGMNYFTTPTDVGMVMWLVLANGRWVEVLYMTHVKFYIFPLASFLLLQFPMRKKWVVACLRTKDMNPTLTQPAAYRVESRTWSLESCQAHLSCNESIDQKGKYKYYYFKPLSFKAFLFGWFCFMLHYYSNHWLIQPSVK